mgnify:CR=1 FL=1
MTVLALAGCIPPAADGEVCAEIPSELALPLPSAWSAIYASEPAAVATLWPEADSLDALMASVGSSEVKIGSNLLALLDEAATADDLSTVFDSCFSALREKRLGWITVYPCNGEVWQWNRAALRTGVAALLGRGSGT